MPAASFRVVLTALAEADLYEIESYWSDGGESWRGEKYFGDLTRIATSELSDAATARRGRLLRDPKNPDAREFLAFGIYRVIYRIDEALARVEVLRFWHAHRDVPPLE